MWFAGFAAVAAATVPLGLVHVLPLTAECVLLLLLVVAGLVLREAEVVVAWSAWLAGIVALDDIRVLQRLAGTPHAADVIRFEAWAAGGRLPVVELQRHLAAPAGGLRISDVALSLVYLLHSPAPLVCGAVLWRRRRHLFAPFVAAILLAASVGLVIYLAFPETPPWLAAQHGLMPPVRRITSEVIAHVGPLNAVYGGADPLPNAAMPSLHVAYPAIVAAFTLAAFGRRAWWIALYPLLLAPGVVYLGEHFAVDVVAGLLVAATAVVTGLAVGRRGRGAEEERG